MKIQFWLVDFGVSLAILASENFLRARAPDGNKMKMISSDIRDVMQKKIESECTEFKTEC